MRSRGGRVTLPLGFFLVDTKYKFYTLRCINLDKPPVPEDGEVVYPR